MDVSPRKYLSEVDDVLERNRHLTWGGGHASSSVPVDSRPFSRKRSLTSPLLPPGHHRPSIDLEMLKEEQSGTSSDGEASTSSLSASSEVEARGQTGMRGQVELKGQENVKSTRRRWSSMGVGREDTGRWQPRHCFHNDTLRVYDHHPSPTQTQVLDSLQTINSQLGELLDRVGAPAAPAARLSLPAAIPYRQQQPATLPEESTLPSNARYTSNNLV